MYFHSIHGQCLHVFHDLVDSNTAPLRLVSGIQEASPYPACRVGSFYYYNRALSTTDIQTIFTATRTRFGV